MKKLKATLSLIFFAVGIALLSSMIRKAGSAEIIEIMSRLGLNLCAVLLLPILWYGLQSFAWLRVLKDENHSASFVHVFLAKITGEAVNTVTPVSILGGDPYRAHLLNKRVAGPAGTASVIIDRTMHTVATFALVMVTLALAWVRLDLPPAWRLGMPAALIALLSCLLAIVTLQRRGAIRHSGVLFLRLTRRFPGMENFTVKLSETDAHVGSFYRKHKLHFLEILALHFASRLIGAVEIWLIARFLGLELSAENCLYLTSLTVLINMAFVFIPGSLGVMEGGYGALFYLLHLNPAHGVVIQLVRRVRTIFWTFFGMMVILFYHPAPITREDEY